eukprot:m.71818 g.71818  ORF g.71818 m.71818 type:complete len:488 (-) comp18669_c0_seq1:84-1547(-)
MASPVGLLSQSSYTELVYKRHRGVAKKLKKIVEIEERSKDSTVRLQEDQKTALSKKPELEVLARELETLKLKFTEYDDAKEKEGDEVKVPASVPDAAPSAPDFTAVANLFLALSLSGKITPSTAELRAAVACLGGVFDRVDRSTPETAVESTAAVLEAYAAGGSSPSAELGGVAAEDVAAHVACLLTVVDQVAEDDETAEAETMDASKDSGTEDVTVDTSRNLETAAVETAPEPEPEPETAASMDGTQEAGATAETVPPTEVAFGSYEPVVLIDSAPLATDAVAQVAEPGFEFMGPSFIDEEQQRLANDAVYNDPAIVLMGTEPTPPPVTPPTVAAPAGGAPTNGNARQPKSGASKTHRAPPTVGTNGASQEGAAAVVASENGGQWSSKGRGGKDRGRGKKSGGRGRGEGQQGGGRGRGEGQQGGSRGRGDSGRGRGKRGRSGGRGGGRGEGGRGEGGGRGETAAAATNGAWGKGRGRGGGATAVAR